MRTAHRHAIVTTLKATLHNNAREIIKQYKVLNTQNKLATGFHCYGENYTRMAFNQSRIYVKSIKIFREIP